MCTNLGICLSVPRNRVILWGIINIIVGISLLVELTRGEFYIVNGIKFQSTDPTPTTTPTTTENGYYEDDSKNGITTPQTESECDKACQMDQKLAVSRICCGVVIILSTMVAGIFAIFCCNSHQNRKRFATISKLSLAVSITISVTLAIVHASLGKSFGPLYNVPTMFLWGSIIQVVWWIFLNGYLRHPGLEPGPLDDYRRVERGNDCWDLIPDCKCECCNCFECCFAVCEDE